MNRTVGIVLALLVVLGLAIYINAQRQDGTEWQDGTYVARSTPDDRGYFGEIEIVIAEGRISEVEYEEMDREGTPKGEDYPYPLGPESHDQYEDSLVETQDPDQVDAISGATETRDRFVEAAREALRKAETGDQSRPPMIQPPATPAVPPEGQMGEGQWEDGTYTARTETDEYGYYGEIEIIISDNRITEVTYDEKDQEGNPKGEDYPYPLGPESEDEFEAQLIETQDPEQVDNITGATQTWERFKQTATDALEQASQDQGQMDNMGDMDQDRGDEDSQAQTG